jgi:hypothetical protein
LDDTLAALRAAASAAVRAGHDPEEVRRAVARVTTTGPTRQKQEQR